MHQKSAKSAITDTLKVLILNMNHIFIIVVMVQCKKLLDLMMLLLFMLMEVLKELIFDI